VFLGLNPGYDPNEDVPRLGARFADWEQFFKSRFEKPLARWHKLYRRYQRIGEQAVGDDFCLGTDAITTEVVRFRSAKGAGCDDGRVIDHEVALMHALLAELAPRVIVANGGGALWALQLAWPALADIVPIGTPIQQAEGSQFLVEMPWGRTAIVPTRHLSASFGFRLDMLDRLATVVATALRSW
jgi:hypothetical protein